MTETISTVDKYDGDVVKFLGDAALVSFAAKHPRESDKDIVTRAFACCLDLMLHDSSITINLDGINVVGDDEATYKKHQKTLEQVSQYTSSSSSSSQTPDTTLHTLTLGTHTALTSSPSITHLIMGLPDTRLDHSLHGSALFNLGSLLDNSTVGELAVDMQTARWVPEGVLNALGSFAKVGEGLLLVDCVRASRGLGEEMAEFGFLRREMKNNELLPGAVLVDGEEEVETVRDHPEPEVIAKFFNQSLLRQLAQTTRRESHVPPAGRRESHVIPRRESMREGQGHVNFRGEFRKVTVVFVKLSPSTQPDDANRIFVEFVKSLDKWQGVLQQYAMDDKGQTLLACFGLPPWTFEKDALHAWKAVYEFSNSIKKMGIKDTHIGVGTGELLFTELGSHLRGDASLLGDVVNLAARLLSVSKTVGTTVCDKATYEIIMQDVQLAHLGDFKVKGKIEKVPVYGVKKKTGNSKSDGSAFVSVGYGREKAMLDEKYHDCISQASEIEQWSPFFALQNPLEMFIDTYKSLAEHLNSLKSQKDVTKSGGLQATSVGSISMVSKSDTVSARYKRTRSIGASKDDFHERMVLQYMMSTIQEDPLMYTTLSCVLPGRIRESTESSAPQDGMARRNIAQDLIVKLFKNLTNQQTMVFIFDDCQWVDIVSLQVFQRIVEECPKIGILFFTRPIADIETDYMQKIASTPSVLHLQLGGLRIEDTEQLLVKKLDHLKSIKMVESNLLKGHPLYIDMLIGALQVDSEDSSVEITGSGILKAKQWDLFEETVKKIQNTGAAIVQFGRLENTLKDLLRKASIFGQYFNLSDIIEALGMDDMTVGECLDAIESMDKYFFLALQNVMTAIYESLPYEQRVDMHLSCAQYFEKQMKENDAADSLMPVVAYHYSKTTDVVKHIQYLEILAYKNFTKCYYDEAANSLEHLIEIIKRDLIESHAPVDQRAALLDPVRHADWLSTLAFTYVTQKIKLHAIPDLCTKAMSLISIKYPITIAEFKNALLKVAWRLFLLWRKTKGGTIVYQSRGVKSQYFPAGVIGHNIGDGCSGTTCKECPKRQRVATLCFRSMLIRGMNASGAPPEALAYALIGMCSEEIKTGAIDIGEWGECCHWAMAALYMELPGISKMFQRQADVLEKMRELPRVGATASLVGFVNFNVGFPENAYPYLDRSIKLTRGTLPAAEIKAACETALKWAKWYARAYITLVSWSIPVYQSALEMLNNKPKKAMRTLKNKVESTARQDVKDLKSYPLLKAILYAILGKFHHEDAVRNRYSFQARQLLDEMGAVVLVKWLDDSL
ncbi:hypothetical protein HDV05_002447 [Chytridiales sp. JEL 0842]|nr:hypothetical protein HDV05_002447 [Chytridiales sp. JEL 0842]